MIHEILKILDTTELQELEKQRVTTDLLRLSETIGNRENLKSFANWRDENESWINNNCPYNDSVVSEYFKSLNSD